jgi:hypothetical protein
VQAEAVDHLTVGRSPRSTLQVVDDPATVAETGEPGTQRAGSAVPSNENIRP